MKDKELRKEFYHMGIIVFDEKGNPRPADFRSIPDHLEFLEDEIADIHRTLAKIKKGK
jgi:hypothetical protein